MTAITTFDNRVLVIDGREYRQARSAIEPGIWIEHRILNGTYWYDLLASEAAEAWADLVARARNALPDARAIPPLDRPGR